MDPVARTVAAFAARDAFGRLSARIAARSGSAGDAEDALAEALAAALAQWPRDGVPVSPEGWLVTVARRRIADAARRGARVARSEAHLTLLVEELEEARIAGQNLPDDRLGLMFVCTHPAIDRGVQAPLILQIVLGLTAAEIADAFLVAPNTMGVRLSRAKTKIRETGISFSVPAPEDRPARVAALLDAIYVAFTRGLIARDATASERRGEALWLARLVAGMMPGEAEAQGLLALLSHVAARHGAGRAAGRYVPLDAQDPALWDGALVAEAEAALHQASALGRPGRFQIEAAIQSVHADRRRTGVTDWLAILGLYDALLVLAPSIGAEVARAGAFVLSGDAAAARAALAELDPSRLAAYAPWWAVRAEVAARTGDPAGAAYAWQVAAGLAIDPAERAFLRGRQKSIAQ